MDDIVIVAAARTPVGSFNGAFGAVPAHVLGTSAIQAVLARAGLTGGDVDGGRGFRMRRRRLGSTRFVGRA